MTQNKARTINCGGTLLDLSIPRVMGILNITPDSFYDGGKYNTEKQGITQMEQMILEGASIIDIGAASTRPGAIEITEDEELARLLPIIKLATSNFPKTILSIDTWRASVAEKAILEGAHIINDISGGQFDEQMFDVIAKYNVPYIIMHTSGRPNEMQQKTDYTDVVADIIHFFSTQLNLLRQKGVHDIILDPGFGFGKSLDQNYQLLNRLSSFNIFDLPILVGVSRKSMVQKLLTISAQEALNATTVLHTMALLNGASILRVHDVKEAMEAISIVTKAQCSKS
jgi:dihydropteroate synthase